MHSRSWIRAASFLLVCGTSTRVPAADPPAPTFERDVAPIFREKCCSCHNPDRKRGGLDLSGYPQTLAGGSSGEVISPGDADASYLWQLVSHASEPKMPPESDRIPADALDVVRRWIAAGAPERDGSAPARPRPAGMTALATVGVRPEGPKVLPPRLPKEPLTTSSRPGSVTALAVSPHGDVAAVGGRGQVLLFDTGTRALLGVLPFPEGMARTLRFSRSGRLLIAGGGIAAQSGRVVVWDVAEASRLFEGGNEFDEILATDISADQRVIALGGPAKVVRLLRSADGEVEATIDRHTDWVMALEFSPDGKLLATGDRAGAADDVLLVLRLGDVAGSDPILISMLVRIAIHSIAASAVWQGWQQDLWKPEDYLRFQAAFVYGSTADALVDALRSERLFSTGLIDLLKDDPGRYMAAFGNGQEASVPVALRLAPGGWLRFNQAALSRCLDGLAQQARATPATGALSSIPGPADMKDLGPMPYTFMARMLVPAVSRAFAKADRSRANIHLVTTVCALERFRADHGGRLPESLAALAPQYLASVPIDPMSGAGLVYQPAADGSFRLYSVGTNARDDGGAGSSKSHTEPLDWAWPPRKPSGDSHRF